MQQLLRRHLAERRGPGSAGAVHFTAFADWVACFQARSGTSDPERRPRVYNVVIQGNDLAPILQPPFEGIAVEFPSTGAASFGCNGLSRGQHPSECYACGTEPAHACARIGSQELVCGAGDLRSSSRGTIRSVRPECMIYVNSPRSGGTARITSSTRTPCRYRGTRPLVAIEQPPLRPPGAWAVALQR